MNCNTMNYTKMARALRVAVIKNVMSNKYITEDQALNLLNAPLNPKEKEPVFDDRDKLYWSEEQFKEWMDSEE